jgi:hypothetical protein
MGLDPWGIYVMVTIFGHFDQTNVGEKNADFPEKLCHDHFFSKNSCCLF